MVEVDEDEGLIGVKSGIESVSQAFENGKNWGSGDIDTHVLFDLLRDLENPVSARCREEYPDRRLRPAFMRELVLLVADSLRKSLSDIVRAKEEGSVMSSGEREGEKGNTREESNNGHMLEL